MKQLRPPCCQHSRYSFVLLEGVRLAQCSACFHQWEIHLRPHRDTDGISADMPGIALR